MPDRARPPRHPEIRAVADRLHSAAIHLLRRARRRDPEMGIGPAQSSALSVLVFVGPQSLGALARLEQVRPPTMSRIVTGLERAGLVRRRRDAADGRAVRLEPTARGRRVLQQGRARRVDALAANVAALTDVEVDMLGRAAELMERLAR